MARGKHKARSTNRRSIHTEAVLAQLRSELELESAALVEAERTLEEVTRLQSELTAENAAVLEEVTPYAEQLRRERDFLRSVFSDVSSHQAAIQDAWDNYASAGSEAAPGATRLERMESLHRTMGLAGVLDTENNLRVKNRSVEAITRLQRARGERRTVAGGDTPEERLVKKLTMILDLESYVPAMIRPSYRRFLIEQGVVSVGEDGKLQVLESDQLTSQQNSALNEAIEVAQRLWESRAGANDADAVHVWGSGNVISTNGAPGDSRLALGFTSPVSDKEIAPLGRLSAGLPLPLPSTPAASRNALARQRAEDALDAWGGVFESRRLVTERLGLSSHPFSPLAHHPHPGQGLAVQNAYARAAFSSWIHLGAGSAYAQAAIGLTAAATYWLPAGQTASFAESEPMDESDRAEMILPFPQVFLAFAEPLVLEATASTTAETDENWRVMSEITHDVYRSNGTAGSLVEGISWRTGDKLWASPTIDQMISELGAHIEGVLLLADSLGRPDDTFAWCLTIPGAYGSTLGRFVIPARRSATEYRDVIDNLTAVVAWAQWHEPDQSTTVPLGVSAEDLEDYISSPDFQRNAKRAGAGIRVVDVGSTNRGGGTRSTRDSEGSDAHVAPHIRRGHWRRQRFGQKLEQSKRIRIAPVLVNAHRGDIAPRVYRLRRSTKDVAH